mmetsp:Transcript_44892/g.143811  ORF Transcript_44892/g.143811 Transcript_44892/m.143811 type:complete len:253 (+) Transcript_44892:721-1479(+)
MQLRCVAKVEVHTREWEAAGEFRTAFPPHPSAQQAEDVRVVRRQSGLDGLARAPAPDEAHGVGEDPTLAFRDDVLPDRVHRERPDPQDLQHVVVTDGRAGLQLDAGHRASLQAPSVLQIVLLAPQLAHWHGDLLAFVEQDDAEQAIATTATAAAAAAAASAAAAAAAAAAYAATRAAAPAAAATAASSAGGTAAGGTTCSRLRALRHSRLGQRHDAGVEPGASVEDLDEVPELRIRDHLSPPPRLLVDLSLL